MSTITKSPTSTPDADRATPWAVVWEWLARPNRYRAVRRFRVAAESGDPTQLAPLLAPGIAVVVDAGEDLTEPTIRVVTGLDDAVALLLHGMAVRPGLRVLERSVNGQAGLILARYDEVGAAMTLDFTGRLISVIWIRLRPENLRHWNRV